MVDVTTTTVIDCSRQTVAEYAANPDNATDWYENIKSVEWQTPKPLKVGSKIDFVAQFLGRRLAYTYEVTELIPGEKLVMRTSYGPFIMETSYQWETVDERKTRMTLRNRGNPSGFSVLIAPFMSLAMKRTNQKDLGRLKSILEKSVSDKLSAEARS